MNKTIIAMSGGVDSSVAAYLMNKMSNECIGVTMKLIDENALYFSPSCCTEKDVEDARSVCEILGIPHHVYNFSADFKKYVIDNFIYCYENGMTPNPCVECNRFIKFSALFEQAQKLGADKVVTGHYARTEYDIQTGRYLLKKALDESKDQTYVLFSLTQDHLKMAYFPLGTMNKDHVRALAQENGFCNAEKKDSQDICFVKDCKYHEFISESTGKTYPEGDFIDLRGNVIGRHKGIIRYTVGQHKKLGMSFSEPMYVVKVDSQSNTVTLGKESDLYSDTLIATNINLISVSKIEKPMRVKAKVRYRQKEADATVTQLDENTLKVVFDTPQRAITKGQSVVVYDGDNVLGGGTIT